METWFQFETFLCDGNEKVNDDRDTLLRLYRIERCPVDRPEGTIARYRRGEIEIDD